MLEKLKPIESLTVADLLDNPVWQFANRDELDETMVYPFRNLPAHDLAGKVIGAQISLANGTLKWALLGNINARSPRLTEHFLSISIENAGKWFSLARYHDPEYPDCGPEALSKFLGLDIDQVFPISFDVRRYIIGDLAALVGTIPKEPRERLSRAEIIAMTVP